MRLLRLYPAQWRARYGEELEALVLEVSGGGRVPWRMRVDIARAGTQERLRSAGLAGDGEPREQARGGALLALCAWALFVLAGCAVQKLSEHWQDAVGAGRGAATAGFDTLVIVAVLASVMVLAGIALALPAAASFLRAGGWPAVRARVLTAAALTAAALAATVALVVVAHGLTPAARAGHDTGYAIGFLAWAALVASCLLAWTSAAVAVARRLRLSPVTLRIEARLAAALALAMAVMTAATAAWWIALGEWAPWFLAAAVAAMLVATLVGAAGARRSLHGARAL